MSGRLLAAAVMAWAVIAAVVATTPQTAVAAPVVGFSDNSPDVTKDQNLVALGVRTVRLVAPWNAILDDPGRLERWISVARRNGWEMHVAFEHAEHDQCPGTPCGLPSEADYRTAFRAFRARYPDVAIITPWNEANHDTQPTARAPGHAAWYFNVVRSECASCTVVAADVLGGQTGLAEWIRSFLANTGSRPVLWGLHNYGDANGGTTTDTDAFLALVQGEVWITETGGIVSFRRGDRFIYPPSETRAAAAVLHALRLAKAREHRIRRVYFYHWFGAGAWESWDSGFTRHGIAGVLRPAYSVLATALQVPTAIEAAPPVPSALVRETQEIAAEWNSVAPMPPEGQVVTVPARPQPGRLRVGRQLRVTRAGRVAVRVGCPAPVDRCAGSVRLRLFGTTQVRAFTVGAADTTEVRFQLPRKARSALRRRARVTATVSIPQAPTPATRVKLAWAKP